MVWTLVVFSFSSSPVTPSVDMYWKDFIIKKSAHVVEYAIFTLLLYRALKASDLDKKRAGIFSLVAAIFYGLTDEYHQGFTPGRTAKLRDVGFDALGSGLMIYFIWYLLPKCPKRLILLAQKLELI